MTSSRTRSSARRAFFALGTVATLMTSGALAGGNCVDYGEYLHTFSLAPSYSMQDVEVRGDFVFITPFQVWDCSDPFDPVMASDVSVGGTDLALYGDYGYACAGGWIRVVDISDPYDAHEVGAESLGQTSRLTVHGDHLYASTTTVSMTIYDLTDPTDPTPVGSYGAANSGLEITIEGSLAYIASGTSGMDIVDVTDPTNPLFLSTTPTPEPCWDVAVRDGIAYLGCAGAGILVYDVSDPTNPSSIGSAVTLNRVYDMTFVGSSLGVIGDRALGGGGLELFDISTPSAPVRTATHSIGLGNAHRLDADSEFIYTGEVYLTLLDPANHQSPAQVFEIAPESRAYDVDFHNDHLYVGGQDDFQILDVSVPSSPVVVGSLGAPDYFRKVLVEGDLAYLGDGSFGLFLVDISIPANPNVLSSVGWGASGADEIVVGGGYAYVVDRFQELRVVDVSDPGSAFLVGSLGIATDVELHGDHLFRVGGGVLEILDVSETPGSPSLIGQWASPGSIGYVTVSGDLAFVEGDKVYALDISDPSTPVLVGESDPLPQPWGKLLLQDDILYVSNSRLTAIDVSVPQFPTVIGGMDSPVPDYYIGSAASAGDVLYLAAGDHGVWGVPAQCDVPSGLPNPPDPAGLVSARARISPNPMTDTAHLSLEPGAAGTVRIFDASGRAVLGVHLEIGRSSGGSTWIWDGSDLNGETVRSGVYYVRWIPDDGAVSRAFEQRIVLVR